MKIKNKSHDTVILGGVHSIRGSEYPLILQPGESAEISPERLALYDEDVKAKLALGDQKPAPAPKLVEPEPAPATPEEIAQNDLVNLLKDANAPAPE